MLPMRLGLTEEQARLVVEEYYEPDIVDAMIRATIRSGMSAYGVIMIRLEGGKFNLFRTPGMMLPKRRKKK